MCPDGIVRRIAGVFVLVSLALAWLVSPWWLLFTAFVGANLVQSSFTRSCPLERMLGHFGVLGCRRAARGDRTTGGP